MTTKLSNIYDFYYKITEEERVKLIGKKIYEVARFKNKIEYTEIYYVIGLNNKCFNYGFNQGLIGLLQPQIVRMSKTSLSKYIRNHGDPHWFKIYAMSPDDLDLCLEFNEGINTVSTYRMVERFMDNHCSLFVDTGYREVFNFAQKELSIGEIGI